MTAPSPKYQALVWGGLGLVVLVIVLSFAKSALSGKISSREPGVADPQTLALTNFFGDVPEFHLTNQLGEVVTRESLLGHPWLCDIIFTRCPSQCLRLTALLSEVQKALPARSPARLVSLTADPEFDQPPVLKKYGGRFGTDAKKWVFLTGPKTDVYQLAGARGLKFAVAEKKPSERESVNDLFIHTTKIALVDKRGRLRGWLNFDEPASLQTILAAAAKLSAEESSFMKISDLPIVNACLNGLSGVLLAFGYYFIRRGRRTAHRNCMIAAFATSTVFLVCYLVYHAFAGRTVFVHPAWFRPYYLVLLTSHTILAVVIVPLILVTLNRALKERYELHKKIARWTWPLWMYVSVTGVLVYLILYQIYPQR